MTLMTRLLFTFLSVALVGAMLLAPAWAQENCLTDAEVQAAVAGGEIQPVARVLEREGVPASTQVLSVRVCETGGELSYVLAVLGEAGEASTLTLSAR